MKPDAATELLTEWERHRGDEAKAHFEKGWAYLKNSVVELIADDRPWMIDEHGLLIVAGDRSVVILNLIGPTDRVVLTGELHATQLGLMEADFKDGPGERVAVGPIDPIEPMVRRWRFHRTDGFAREVAYWVEPKSCPPGAEPILGPELAHYRRREDVAHRLARAVGWPLPAPT